jgi:small subunit ribosomal protein S20
MPIIQSAKKKMRKDKVRTQKNKVKRETLKTLIKKVRSTNNAENLTAVFSALDKAAKTNLIHPNKASRLKSRLSKGTSGSGVTKKVSSKKKVTKKAR